jgi:hypothetical protein
MTEVIEDLLHSDVEPTFARTPADVQSDLGKRYVVASAFFPGGRGFNPAHLVVYNRGSEHQRVQPTDVIPATDATWAVALLVHDEDAQRSYLTNGDYDMTFARAMAVFVRRIERQR